MQHKARFALLTTAVGALLAFIALRHEFGAGAIAANEQVAQTAPRAGDAAIPFTDPDAPRSAPRSRPANGSPWLSKTPATTVSSIPADLAARPRTSHATLCPHFHGGWTGPSGEHLHLEPGGAATWSPHTGDDRDVVWECSRSGTVRVILPGRVLEFRAESGLRIVESGGVGEASIWTADSGPGSQ